MLMVLFQIGPNTYAIDSEPIVEIFPKIKIKKIPGTESSVAGLINYCGKPVPVIDLSQIILKRPSEPALHTRIILLQSQSQLLGLIAEKVIEAEEVDQSSFIIPGIASKELPFLGGLYIKEETTIQLVKMADLFNYLQNEVSIKLEPDDASHG